MWQWQVTEFEAGQRLLDALAQRVPAAPRAFLQQIVRKGRIHWGDRPAAVDLPLIRGMCLAVRTSGRFTELADSCGVPPQDLLFEDRHALVIFKPAGLALHRAAGHDDNLTSRAARFAALRHAPYRLAPVHRLDIGTSGPVLFAKGRWSSGQYGRQLMAGNFGKHYLTLVAGRVPEHGRLSTAVVEGRQSRPALTRYRRLAMADRCSLLELELVTGRRHQARQQLATAGWPIIGDRRYGGPPWPGLDHPFLHCHRLTFPSLEDGQPRQVNCPLPLPLAGLLAAAGLPGWAGAAILDNCPAENGKRV